MCGIVGVLGNIEAAPRIVDSLKRLEYRGYDSAGVATLIDGGLVRRRAEGKLRNLEAALERSPLSGTSGIGHTRWATHGAPTLSNAHPHQAGSVALVHNGIIENYLELRDEVVGAGAVLSTDTDTEVVAHLIDLARTRGLSPREAVAETLPRLKGAFALALLFAGEDDLMIGARKGSPLAIGHGEGEMFFGSDAIALSPFTDRITYLDEGDWAVLTRDGVQIFDRDNSPVERPEAKSSVTSSLMDKGNYKHFMAKEIHEQPEVLGHTLSRYFDYTTNTANVAGAEKLNFNKLSRLLISACGTAYLAGLVSKYWFEKYARLPVEIDIASEFRYRETPVSGNDAALFISQSGETADTLASLRYCKENGAAIGAVVNVPESTIAREADMVYPTIAGPEIGVASTKAFTCQLAVLAALALQAGRERGVLSAEREQELVSELTEIPSLALKALAAESEIEKLSQPLSKADNALYLGRSTNYPLALEGALKLKELSYIHAEGYAAGELKHGPIALIDENMPVFVIAPYDSIYEKTVSNMQEVAARGGRIVLITDRKGAEESGGAAENTVIMPDMSDIVAPIIYALPVQLIAYHTAVFMGTDVDQPRNLAKSVTVE
ncbi:glutamine--fructose-6-phosphate transaminase (isomerizing) [Roseibium album]|uniref:Glutamine--fructose-6-phosphate aminotransferase [isomerizing] n=1 Tax=Roseibium album TaxID=311410 RepID=A0A0M7AW30_9HYPH|nr:glutamine--fructose-6-phosphate transaminase (isomerizing) [Roseibium album]CTQ62264.1 Glutamine--fructose-6-phosphate aminotransferase [isomerizing] [Roseibium album]CTQ77784.1 Glutamine--fructose-6-phosphate aminotransferase [isomerizing] [Roseibium album]CTQ80029.1 Glutamine--fructose-6-phosphate aminotransferase [isomerizing] [Roseibium album]